MRRARPRARHVGPRVLQGRLCRRRVQPRPMLCARSATQQPSSPWTVSSARAARVWQPALRGRSCGRAQLTTLAVALMPGHYVCACERESVCVFTCCVCVCVFTCLCVCVCVCMNGALPCTISPPASSLSAVSRAQQAHSTRPRTTAPSARSGEPHVPRASSCPASETRRPMPSAPRVQRARPGPVRSAGAMV